MMLLERPKEALERQDVDLDEDALDEVFVEMTDDDNGVTDEELSVLFPRGLFRGTPRDQAKKATQQALGTLPSSLRSIITYPSHEYPGVASRDTINTAGEDFVDSIKDLKIETEMKHHRPYLLGMGAAFQILATLFFKHKEFDSMRRKSRQQVLIAMDLLSGCLNYGVSMVKGEYDHGTRLGFLLTKGKHFASEARVKRLFKANSSGRNMKLIDDPLLTDG